MIKRFAAAALLLCLLLTPTAALAAPQDGTDQCNLGFGNFLFFKPWDACLPHDANGVPQLQNLNSIWLVALTVLEDAIRAAGYAAAGFLTWGGIKYLKSQGDPGQINEARLVIFNALFGLLLAMISIAIVNFITGAF